MHNTDVKNGWTPLLCLLFGIVLLHTRQKRALGFKFEVTLTQSCVIDLSLLRWPTVLTHKSIDLIGFVVLIVFQGHVTTADSHNSSWPIQIKMEWLNGVC